MVQRAVGGRRGPDGPTPGSPADLQPDADPEEVARSILLRRLTAAPRTRAELASDLARRGVPEDVATRVLDRFTEVGLVDDDAFAQAWVQSRSVGRGLSRRALAGELRRRGIDDEVARDALAGLDDGTELAGAQALVRTRLPSTRGLPPEARIRRLVGMLARRGYPAGTALGVVREALAAEGDDDDRGDAVGPGDGFERWDAVVAEDTDRS